MARPDKFRRKSLSLIISRNLFTWISQTEDCVIVQPDKPKPTLPSLPKKKENGEMA